MTSTFPPSSSNSAHAATDHNKTASAATMIDPDGLNNTLVAESDFEAARQALLNFAASRKHKNPNVDETTSRTQDMVARSLLDHLQAAVRPVTDECFHMYCYELQKQQQDYPDDNNNNDDTEKAADDNNVDLDNDDDDDDNKDWEDWVNQPLLERVRNLRQQVRDQAVRVSQVRDGVLEQAVTLARRRCEAATSTTTTRGNSSSSSSNNNGMSLSSLDTLAMKDSSNSNNMIYEQKVMEMQESIQKMKQTLTMVETRLPDSVRQWQETLDTIENETSVRYSNSQTGASGGAAAAAALSQTEQAIMEREDEDDDDHEMNDDDDNHVGNNNINNNRHTAEERLSRFVSNNILT